MKVLHCLTLTIWPFFLALLCLMKKWICTSTFKDPPHSHTFIIPSETLRVCSRHQTEGTLDRGLPCLCVSGGFIIWQASFWPWNWFIKFCFFCDFLREFWPSEAVKNECGLSEIKAVSWKKTLNPLWRLYKISQKVQAFLREGRSMMTRVKFSELWEGCGKEYFLLTHFLKFVQYFFKKFWIITLEIIGTKKMTVGKKTKSVLRLSSSSSLGHTVDLLWYAFKEFF